ncbi:MAG: serine/threonine protein kinase [Candidatus Eremiobacteraeota bacterium]|nr:serine/threonine protein kinase [Candidatus Eremiobacteraeota bacterium]
MASRDETTCVEGTELEFVDQSDRSFEGQTVAGYRLEEVVGRGGFGRVYRALDQHGKVWAAKELLMTAEAADDTAQSRVRETLEREQKILSWLSHEGIVTRKEALIEHDRIFLILEYLEGANLRDRLAESELSMPQGAVLELGLQLADVLGYLHAQKPYPIVFSDLKPANLMLTADGRVKLIDFGIARLATPRQQGLPAMGTPGYAAPEQYQGDFDVRADIYALGVVMHNLLSRQEPRLLKLPLPRVGAYATAVDRDLEAIITRATRVDPEERFSSVRLMGRSLEELLEKWGRSRADLRGELVAWSGLKDTRSRLASAIDQSVHEVNRNRADRARPLLPDPKVVRRWQWGLALGGALALLAYIASQL